MYNHYFSGRAVSITYVECVFVAIRIQHAMNMLHIVICGLNGTIIFFSYYLIHGIFFEKKSY